LTKYLYDVIMVTNVILFIPTIVKIEEANNNEIWKFISKHYKQNCHSYHKQTKST